MARDSTGAEVPTRRDGGAGGYPAGCSASIAVTVTLRDIGQATHCVDNLIGTKDGGLFDWGPSQAVVTEALLADVFRVDVDRDGDTHTGPHVASHHALEE